MVVVHCLKRTTRTQHIIKDNLVRNGQKIHQASIYIIQGKARQSLQKLFPGVTLHKNQIKIVENYNTRTWRRELREKDVYPYKLCVCVCVCTQTKCGKIVNKLSPEKTFTYKFINI